MQYQEQGEKARRRKVIIVSVAAAILVLVLGIWIISAAINTVNKNKNKTTVEQTTSQTTTEPSKNENDDNDVPTNEGTISQNITITKPTAQPAAPVNAQSNNIAPAAEVPYTGPTDMFVTALLMGAAAYLAVSLYQNKKANAEV